jgi:soluble lytic murein transglycosylase-like protein
MLGWNGVGKPQAMFGWLAILLAPASASAELYSFVDEEGVIHLTNVKKGREYKPYQATEEQDDFGGQKPIVIVYKTGEERVVYPVNVSRFDEALKEAAQHYNLPFAFLKAIAKVESNFDPHAVSHKNAKGLMQLIDATAADMNVSDPFDPRQNIFGGARYLRILANEFGGNMALTAAAYNAGPDRVKRVGRVPDIRETQRYVRRVLMMYRHYKRSE